MSKSSDTRLEQVKRYGTGLRRLSKALFAITVVAGAAAILLLAFGTSEGTSLAIGNAIFPAAATPPLARLLGVGGAVLGLWLALRLLFHMTRLFDLYAQGRIFTLRNVGHIRQIGMTVFLFLTLWLYDIVAQFVLAQFAPATLDGRDVTIGVGRVSPVVDGQATPGLSIDLGDPFGIVILGIVIVFFSWIMDVGRELREEQDLVV